MSELMIVASAAVSKCSPRSQFVNKKIGQVTHGDQPSSPNPGHGPHNVEGQHNRGHGASKTASHEGCCGYKEAETPSKQIGQSAIERLERRVRDQVRCRQPGSVVCRTKLGTDGGIRRRRDGGVESRQKDVGPQSCPRNISVFFWLLDSTQRLPTNLDAPESWPWLPFFFFFFLMGLGEGHIGRWRLG